jgi:hypothetical protein
MIIRRFRRFPRVFAAPKRIGLKSHIRLSGVVVKASSRKQPFAVAPIAPQQQQLAMSRHAFKCVAAFCFAPTQVDIWHRAGAGDAGQLQRVLRGAASP